MKYGVKGATSLLLINIFAEVAKINAEALNIKSYPVYRNPQKFAKENWIDFEWAYY